MPPDVPASDNAGTTIEPRIVFVTGFPVFAARRLVREMVAGGDEVWLLVRNKFLLDANEFVASLAADIPQGPPVRVLEGDILDIDLGLTGAEVRDLHAHVQEIHHIAAVNYLGTPTRKKRLVNVEGLREVLEFAFGMKKLDRICHWSTAFVAGARGGVVYENELMVGQAFRNDYEETKAAAEVLARNAMSKLPITIVRPSILVGASDTGRVDRFDGVYLAIRRIVAAPPNVSVPLPGHGRFDMHVVPVDYVARATRYLARNPGAVGATVHLVDSQPLSAGRFFDAVADAAGRPRPTAILPGGVARAVLNLPGIRAIARNDLEFVEWLDSEVRFDATNADRLLAGSGITCPPVQSYVDVLVRYVRDHAT